MVVLTANLLRPDARYPQTHAKTTADLRKLSNPLIMSDMFELCSGDLRIWHEKAGAAINGEAWCPKNRRFSRRRPNFMHN